MFIYDTPAQHAKIDPFEKAYIEASVEKKDEVSILVQTKNIHRKDRVNEFHLTMSE